MEKAINPKQKAAKCVEELLVYGFKKNLISKLDQIFIRNRLFDLLKIDEPYIVDFDESYLPDLHLLLEVLIDYAVLEGIIEDSITKKDLFDAKIMGLLTPMPSTVAENFYNLEKRINSQAATDYFYKICEDVNYIRTDRISKNNHWTASTD
jgi:UDPglucose--hexose-1-phosphate uridylyltransferase